MKPTNPVDRLVSYFSPRAGARRARDRLILEKLSSLTAKGSLNARKYEGAAVGRRTDGWFTSSTSANTETQGALTRLRNRSRDLVRNDPHATNAIAVIATQMIGTGIMPRPFSDKRSKVKKTDTLWKLWGETSSCDINEQQNFYGLQKQAARSIAEGGAVLVRRIWMKDQNLPIPIQLQLLEPDFIDTLNYSNMMLDNGNFVKQGIEFNARGKRVAYYLFEEHPGEMSAPFSNLKSVRVPAEDVLHCYRIDRIGQIHGIPWSAPIIIKLRDFNDYDDAQLLRQKIAACFSAFVYDADGTDVSPLGSNDTTKLVDTFESGTIEILPPGKDIKFTDPPSVEGYADFSRGHLRSIASGFGITYEALTNDYSQVNYSSGRMGQIQMQANVRDWQWNMFIPMFNDRIWRWFIEAATLVVGDVSDVGARWTPPRIAMLDPTKEIAAKKDEIRTGLTTWAEAVRENGNDPDEVIEEIKETNAKFDAAGIKLDTDPRYVTEFGQEQPSVYQNQSSVYSDNKSVTSDSKNSAESESKKEQGE